jgi:hypothetical protein
VPTPLQRVGPAAHSRKPAQLSEAMRPTYRAVLSRDIADRFMSRDIADT